MKLLSTEIDETTMQLVYTDGGPLDDAGQAVLIRLPLQGPLKRPVLWHQLMILRESQTLLEAEAQRVRAELEKID